MEMQQPRCRHALHLRERAAIFAVAQDRRAQRRAMRAQLMGAAGHRLEREPGDPVAGMGDGAVIGDGALAFLVVGTTRSPQLARQLGELLVDAALARFRRARPPPPNRSCASILPRKACGELRRRRGRCAPAPARRWCPCRGGGRGAGVPRRRSAARRACRRDGASVLVPPCTARPCGLSITITSSSRCSTAACKQRAPRARWAASAGAAARLPASRSPKRRHADDLARRTRSRGLGALAVEADLAGAQQLLQPAMAEAGEMPLEPAVEADLGIIGRDRDGLNLSHAANLTAAGAGHHPGADHSAARGLALV